MCTTQNVFVSAPLWLLSHMPLFVFSHLEGPIQVGATQARCLGQGLPKLPTPRQPGAKKLAASAYLTP